jgi:hypothetical protein
MDASAARPERQGNATSTGSHVWVILEAYETLRG